MFTRFQPVYRESVPPPNLPSIPSQSTAGVGGVSSDNALASMSFQLLPSQMTQAQQIGPASPVAVATPSVNSTATTQNPERRSSDLNTSIGAFARDRRASSTGATVAMSPMAAAVPEAAAGSSPVPDVAMASLAETANSVGMSLEQLATTLRSHSNLAQVLNSSTGANYKTRQELAMMFYQNECRSLYEKVMLEAGFSPEEAREGSQTHTAFSLEAYQVEGQRLESVVQRSTRRESSTSREGARRESQHHQDSQGQQQAQVPTRDEERGSPHSHHSMCIFVVVIWSLSPVTLDPNSPPKATPRKETLPLRRTQPRSPEKPSPLPTGDPEASLPRVRARLGHTSGTSRGLTSKAPARERTSTGSDPPAPFPPRDSEEPRPRVKARLGSKGESSRQATNKPTVKARTETIYVVVCFPQRRTRHVPRNHLKLKKIRQPIV